MKQIFAFVGGFFRAHADESSARLVGIASCFAAIAYAFTHAPTPGTLTQTGLLFTNGLIALGLRKGLPGETVVETAEATVRSIAITPAPDPDKS